MYRRQGRTWNICFDLIAMVVGRFISHEIYLAAYDRRMAAIGAIRL